MSPRTRHIFAELCEDENTRLIALNDNMIRPNPVGDSTHILPSCAHEEYNRDTALRIRRTLRNRFSQGGVFQCNIFGYVKPPGAKMDSEVHKDPNAEPVYDEWFQKLESGAPTQKSPIGSTNRPSSQGHSLEAIDGQVRW